MGNVITDVIMPLNKEQLIVIEIGDNYTLKRVSIRKTFLKENDS